MLPRGIRRAFRLARARRRVDAEVGDEIAFHIEMRTAELVARGWPEDAARAEALRKFGDVRRWSDAMGAVDRERERRARLVERGAAVWQDIRQTLRGLARQPAFTAGVVLTMALGIGANATMFGIVDRLLLRPPAHVQDADRIRRLYFVQTSEAGEVRPTEFVSYSLYAAARDSAREVARLAGYTTRDLVLGSGPGAREISVGVASADLFPLLGVRAALGRFFGPDEDRVPLGEPVAVLGHELWRAEFGGDTAVLGRTVRIRNRDFEVIGVAPPGFTGVNLERIDAWIPITVFGHDNIGRFVPVSEWHTTRNVVWMSVVGRLAPGVDDARADAVLSRFFRRWEESAPVGRRGAPTAAEIQRANPHVVVGPVQRDRGPECAEETRVAAWLAGVAGVVLLIACANVANLLLARAMRRRREIAVRLALGVGRRRLMGQLLAESIVLALLGGAAAVLVASWGGDVVRSVLLPDIAWGSTLADPRVLAFTGAVALLTGLVAGLVPAVQASRPDLAAALKAGAREGGGQRSRTRSALLVAQAALSVVLLAGAGLFVRSLQAVSATDLGYDPQGVLFTDPSFAAVGYTNAEGAAIAERVHERARAMPGVALAARTSSLPFYSMSSTTITVPGLDSIPRLPASDMPLMTAVTPEYFATMGTRIVRGRGFTERDVAGAPRVLVVNGTMARLLWPGQDAIGKCVRLGDADSIPCTDVVGIAQETHWREIRPEPVMQYYVPFAQRQAESRATVVLVRPSGDPGAVADAMRRLVLEEAPKLSFVEVQPLAELVDPQLRPWRLGASLFTAFGLLALVIAAVGLYSVLAYLVAQRRHEIGVRLALGARTSDVLRLVIGEGVRVVAVGVAIGLAAALLAGRAIEGMLYGVRPHDPAVAIGVAVVLLVVAVAASFAPAWRASRVDPSTTLRAD